MPAADPSSQRRKLKAELPRVRVAAGMTQREAAERLDWSLSKLIRVETGVVSLSVTDLRAMLQLYGVTDERLTSELSDAARGSRGTSWWSPYRDLLSVQFALYLGHEGSASTVHVFHPFLVPGLLQTAEYGYALLRVHRGPKEAQRVLDLRLQRQEHLFGRTDSPDVRFILNQESLYREIGGPAVMRRQLQHLADIQGQTPGRIQIVPFTAGAHPGLLGPFIVLGFADSGEHMLFVEGASGDLVSRDDGEKISQSVDDFELMLGLALPDGQSHDLLTRLIESLGDKEGDLGQMNDHLARSLSRSLTATDLSSRSAHTEEDRWPPGVWPHGARGERLTLNQSGNQRPSLDCSARPSMTGTMPYGLSLSSAVFSSSPSSQLR